MRVSIAKVTLATSIAFAGALTGCGGGSADVKGEVNTTATGQQLIDLKKALDAGAITQGQYEKEKARILRAN